MKKRMFSLLPLALVLAVFLCVPAFALTKSEVEAQVAASGKAAVTGNVLIWFLCAVAFLKVSQKIDSFLASMGINVGRTGGSLLGEAMIAARGVSMLVKAGGGAIGKAMGGSSGGTSSGSSGSGGGFFKGGLIGMAGRHFTNNTVKATTSQASAVHTAQKQSATSATHTTSSAQSAGTHTASSVQSAGAHTANTIHTSGSTDSATHTVSTTDMGGADTTIHSAEHTSSEAQSDAAVFADTVSQQEGIVFTGHESQTAVHSESSSQASQSDSSTQADHTASPGEHIHSQGSVTETSHSNVNTQTVLPGGIGGAVFCRSLATDGKLANEVISTVATGDTHSAGCIAGDMASYSLRSYMGYTSQSQGVPFYSDVEIRGGRISGTETPDGSFKGTAFCMYHAEQYAAPQGPHEQIRTADGALWYKQFAQDTVERTPCKAPDGSVTYNERAVKKLPTPPKRKDRT